MPMPRWQSPTHWIHPCVALLHLPMPWKVKRFEFLKAERSTVALRIWSIDFVVDDLIFGADPLTQQHLRFNFELSRLKIQIVKFGLGKHFWLRSGRRFDGLERSRGPRDLIQLLQIHAAKSGMWNFDSARWKEWSAKMTEKFKQILTNSEKTNRKIGFVMARRKWNWRWQEGGTTVGRYDDTITRSDWWLRNGHDTSDLYITAKSNDFWRTRMKQDDNLTNTYYNNATNQRDAVMKVKTKCKTFNFIWHGSLTSTASRPSRLKHSNNEMSNLIMQKEWVKTAVW